MDVKLSPVLLGQLGEQQQGSSGLEVAGSLRVQRGLIGDRVVPMQPPFQQPACLDIREEGRVIGAS